MKKKESKHNYKYIIGIIIGGLIFGTLGTIAATQIASANVTYSKNGTSVTVESALNDLFNKTLYLGKIKLGDYVKMTPNLTSYTIPTTDTGYSLSQTINPSELNIWRIISINSDGTADAVSEYVSSTNVIFGTSQSNKIPTASNSNVIAYANYVGTLNKISTSYNNVKYVVNTRHTGYSGETQYITDTSKLTSTSAPWAEYIITATPEQERLGAGGNYFVDYSLLRDIIGHTWAYKVGTTTAAYYWLASRRYEYNTSGTYHFSLKQMSASGDATSAYSIYSYYYNSNSWNYNSKGNSIRPIITLRASLTTNGGDGKTESTAWTFS